MEKETLEGSGWKVCVVLESGFPKIMWSYNFPDGSFGGLLYARPAAGNFALHTSKNIGNEIGGHPVKNGHTMKFNSDETEKLISILTVELGWGEPPHFSQVSQDIVITSNKLPVNSYEEAKVIADELTLRWEAMAAEQ